MSGALVVLSTLGFASCNSGVRSSEGSSTDAEPEAMEEAVNGDFKISLAQWSLHKTFLGEEVTDWQGYGRADAFCQGCECQIL